MNIEKTIWIPLKGLSEIVACAGVLRLESLSILFILFSSNFSFAGSVGIRHINQDDPNSCQSMMAGAKCEEMEPSGTVYEKCCPPGSSKLHSQSAALDFIKKPD